MNSSIIELNNIEMLPNNTLAILKDNLSDKSIYSLCLKDDIIDYNSCLKFRLGFIQSNNIPICILMIKTKNKFYKTLISFNLFAESEYLKNLLCLKTFNLFLFSNNNVNTVYKVHNSYHLTFSRTIKNMEKYLSQNSYEDILVSKENLLEKYTDEELWKLAK